MPKDNRPTHPTPKERKYETVQGGEEGGEERKGENITRGKQGEIMGGMRDCTAR